MYLFRTTRLPQTNFYVRNAVYSREVVPYYFISTGIGKQGEILMVHNVTRDCGGSYVCEASNGVKPQQSREMKVVVQCKYTSFISKTKHIYKLMDDQESQLSK